LKLEVHLHLLHLLQDRRRILMLRQLAAMLMLQLQLTTVASYSTRVSCLGMSHHSISILLVRLTSRRGNPVCPLLAQLNLFCFFHLVPQNLLRIQGLLYFHSKFMFLSLFFLSEYLRFLLTIPFLLHLFDCVHIDLHFPVFPGRGGSRSTWTGDSTLALNRSDVFGQQRSSSSSSSISSSSKDSRVET